MCDSPKSGWCPKNTVVVQYAARFSRLYILLGVHIVYKRLTSISIARALFNYLICDQIKRARFPKHKRLYFQHTPVFNYTQIDATASYGPGTRGGHQRGRGEAVSRHCEFTTHELPQNSMAQHSTFLRSHLLILGPNSIQSLLPVTPISQVEALLESHRIEDVILLADQQRKKVQGKLVVDANEVSILFSGPARRYFVLNSCR
jgi:hypothetical protein